MHVSDPAPARIGMGWVQSRVRSSTSLGSSFCIAGVRVWGLEGDSGSVLSQEVVVESVPAVGVGAGHCQPPTRVFSGPGGWWDGVVLC